MEFKAYAQKEDYLEVLFGELKAFKRSLEDKTEAGETMKTVPQTPINIFSHQIEAFTAASEQKQKAVFSQDRKNIAVPISQRI